MTLGGSREGVCEERQRHKTDENVNGAYEGHESMEDCNLKHIILMNADGSDSEINAGVPLQNMVEMAAAEEAGSKHLLAHVFNFSKLRHAGGEMKPLAKTLDLIRRKASKLMKTIAGGAQRQGRCVERGGGGGGDGRWQPQELRAGASRVYR